MIYTIELRDKVIEVIGLPVINRDGTLIVYDDNSIMICSYATGQWVSVVRK